MSNKLYNLDYCLRSLEKDCSNIKKVRLHSSLSEGLKNRKALLGLLRSFQVLTGRIGHVIKTKKSVASFSSREGSEIGVGITLRGTDVESTLAWLNSEAFPMLLSQETPRLRGLKEDTTPSFGVGVPSSTDVQKLAIESSLAFQAFGFDITFEAEGSLRNKNFSASYLGLPIEGRVV